MANVSFTASEKDPPYAAMIVARLGGIEVATGPKTSVTINGTTLEGAVASRALARFAGLYGGNDPMAATEVDHWVAVAARIAAAKDVANLAEEIGSLNGALRLRTFLVGEAPTLADASVYAAVRGNAAFADLDSSAAPNVARYLRTCEAVPAFAEIGSRLAPKSKSKGAKEGGKFFDLKGAKEGEVVTRFPPEASGYLHIGHATAASINQYLARLHKGKLIMRFDDTNPEKESAEFEQVILQDLKLLDVKPDMFTHTSDHFDTLLGLAQKLVDEGTAFVDDAPAEEMSELRMKKKPSKRRDASVADNQRLWKAMVAGTPEGLKCCFRIKIDHASDNGALRDPVIYRCKAEPHVRWGDKYKVYPTYDFACPLVDSIEGVTHALRTTEYHDRNPQYEFIAKACGVRVPQIEDFSRLAFQHTCMAKRQLRWFIETGRVKDWSDPSFPTVRGILRRGMTLEALHSFLISQGASKSNALMEWDKIWALNRGVIDPVAPRHTALLAAGIVPLTVAGQTTAKTSVPLHPKNAAVGQKDLWLSSDCWLELADAATLREGEKVTLMDFGNVEVTSVTKRYGVVRAVEVKPLPDDTNYAGTKKLTWLPRCAEEEPVPVECVEIAPLISVKSVAKEDGVEGLERAAAPVPRRTFTLVGSSSLASLQKGDIIQLNRKGFWICDEAPNSLLGKPAVLVDIPDGHRKERSPLREADEVVVGTPESLEEARAAAANYHQQLKDTKKAKGDKDVQRELKANEDEASAIVQLIEASVERSGGQAAAGAGTGADSVAALTAKVKELKAAGAPPAEVEAAVAKLNAADPPKGAKGAAAAPAAAAGSATADSAEAAEILQRHTVQGGKVRAAKEALKAGSGSKDAVDAEVKTLLAIKAEYKTLTAQDVPAAGGGGSGGKKGKSKGSKKGESEPKASGRAPSSRPHHEPAAGDAAAAAAAGGGDGGAAASPAAAEILKRHTEQGGKVRAAKEALKAGSGSKDAVDAEVKTLLAIKAKYKALTGQDVPAAGGDRGGGKKKEGGKGKEGRAKGGGGGDGGAAARAEAKRLKKAADAKGKTKLGVEVPKDVNLSEWYTDVIVKSEMIEYYEVSGCYILRPAAYCIWDFIKDFFDAEIKKLGVENSYFPMFVPQKALEKEKDHIEDFAPEVAWVTRSGNSELAEPIAIRPTSETVMYPSFAKWIQSHRDLPLKLNQWCNVVRWEFKQPQPFLRTREFLWQEGHTVYATAEEAGVEVMQILDLYRRVYEELLACPVVPGRKTEKEKFAGGDYTTTVEAFIPAAGRAIQGATSHHLGQNFAKMFEIMFQGPNDKRKDSMAYQNSWGITTRTIGVMVMVHGDDKGVVAPPRVARHQVVLMVTGIGGKGGADVGALTANVHRFAAELTEAGVRCHVDERDNYTNAWKYNFWELRGCPLRLEYGPRDMEAKKVMLVRRDTGEKLSVPEEGLAAAVSALLERIQSEMFARAKKEAEEHRVEVNDWKDFVPNLNRKNLLLVPFCGGKACEGQIKDQSANAAADGDVDPNAPSMGAKSLCIPFTPPRELKPGELCINPNCGEKATCICMFGRSY